MNKITYFRKCVAEQYGSNRLNEAAESGEALMREYWDNQISEGLPYADDLFNLALIYDEMGIWGQAMDLYAESARLVHEVEGDSIPFISRMTNMAALLARMGRNEQAYRLYTHMAALLRLFLPPADPALADGLYNMANAAADIGRKDEALKLHEEALRIRENAGITHDAIHSLHSIAFLHEGEKTGELSLHYAKEAMHKALNALEGPDIPTGEIQDREHNYYSACFYLAGLFENRGEFENAGPLYEDVMKWTAEQGGNSHSAYLNVASRYANILASQNKNAEALHLHREIADNFKQTIGAAHLFYANNLRSMALLHKRLGEYGAAAELLMESMKIRRTGVDETTTDALLLIDMYLLDDRPDMALEVLVLVLMGAAADQPGYDGLMNDLAEAFARAGGAHLSALSAAMETLCHREKVQAIIRKWEQWGK
jgi:tetratricopeptide (TPR) repeat protein